MFNAKASSLKNKHSDKHYISIFPKLCTVIELVEAIKKDVIIFRSNVQFFLEGAGKNWA